VVVHLFEPAQREYYDLESLWADAKDVEVPAVAARA
jgi:ribosomal silencing factor RsfS